MFCETLLQRNPDLIEWPLYALKKELIEPNTAVLDLDAIEQNAAELSRRAKETGMRLFMMTKQFGRNPLVSAAIARAGIREAVAVNFAEAQILHRNGIKLGHMGHLVQIPGCRMREALSYDPAFITVMSTENAEMIGREAAKSGKIQDILVRVTGTDDLLYDQQLGGISPDDLPRVLEILKRIPGIRVRGFTAFPCFCMDEEAGVLKPTQNFRTLQRAGKIGEANGVLSPELNAPGGNACDTFFYGAENGITQMEPGHSFTGTMYQNAGSACAPEKPAMVYATQVSHHWNGRCFVFGGGFYGRSKILSAFVDAHGKFQKVPAANINPGSIDYYGEIISDAPVGSGAVFCFRTQLFVVDCNIAVVKGLGKGKPRLEGIFNNLGQRIT